MTRKRISPPVSAFDVAAYILANHAKKVPVNAWKMHRLVYFCHIHQWINEGVAMINEKILATPKGVVIKELCVLHHHQWYIGDYSKGNMNHLSLKQIDTIADVMKIYGEKSLEELDKLIQETDPWRKALAGTSNPEISIELNFDNK